MKWLFFILCLMMICTTSYADIASTGYVDSVVAGKQDSITDIATIRSGAGLGSTAVQPSSLSAVARSGSYNDLTNKPTIPTIPTGPNDGNKYTLVWDGKAGRFIFEEIPREPLQCDASAGLYDIGFDQCVDRGTNGTGYGSNATEWTWWTDFDYGRVSGEATCLSAAEGLGRTSTMGAYYGKGEYSSTFIETVKGLKDYDSDGAERRYCWCKMTHPAVSNWVLYFARSTASLCALDCAERCGNYVQSSADMRSGVFGSVGLK